MYLAQTCPGLGDIFRLIDSRCYDLDALVLAEGTPHGLLGHTVVAVPVLYVQCNVQCNVQFNVNMIRIPCGIFQYNVKEDI